MRFHKLEESLIALSADSMNGIKNSGFTEAVRDAQKFYIGDVDDISKFKSTIEDIPRLPYKLCIFELIGRNKMGKTGSVFFLCNEYNLKEMNFLMIHNFVPNVSPLAEYPFLYAGYIEWCRENREFEAFANPSTADLIDRHLKNVCGIENVSGLDEVHFVLLQTSKILFLFLDILNCSNTEIVDVETPDKINKKRKAKRKVPIYSYKTLVLKSRQKRAATGQGAHESPRIHLRRGHIKRRKTGNFWWQPCVVGDKTKGVVVKDYKNGGISQQQ